MLDVCPLFSWDRDQSFLSYYQSALRSPEMQSLVCRTDLQLLPIEEGPVMPPVSPSATPHVILVFFQHVLSNFSFFALYMLFPLLREILVLGPLRINSMKTLSSFQIR